MSVETWINLLAVVGSAIALYFALRKPAKDFEAKTELRFERIEEKLTAKIDGVHAELIEFRIETREGLARHDERVGALERQRNTLMPTAAPRAGRSSSAS